MAESLYVPSMNKIPGHAAIESLMFLFEKYRASKWLSVSRRMVTLAPETMKNNHLKKTWIKVQYCINWIQVCNVKAWKISHKSFVCFVKKACQCCLDALSTMDMGCLDHLFLALVEWLEKLSELCWWCSWCELCVSVFGCVWLLGTWFDLWERWCNLQFSVVYFCAIC